MWIDAVLSLLGGGATGIIGIAVQRFFDYKNKQEDMKAQVAKQAHEVQMKEADAKILAMEWNARTQVATIEAAGKEAVADSQAFAASFDMEPKRYAEGKAPSGTLGRIGWFLMVLLDAFRGAIRPGLTTYLIILVTVIFSWLMAILQSKNIEILDSVDIIAILKRVIDTVLYLATTCVLWWFGTRNKTNGPKELKS